MHRTEEGTAALVRVGGELARQLTAAHWLSGRVDRGARQGSRELRKQITIAAQQANGGDPAALAVVRGQCLLQIVQQGLQRDRIHQDAPMPGFGIVQGAARRRDGACGIVRIALRKADLQLAWRGQGVLEAGRGGDVLWMGHAPSSGCQHHSFVRNQRDVGDKRQVGLDVVDPGLRISRLRQQRIESQSPAGDFAGGLQQVIALIHRIGPERGLALHDLLHARTVALPIGQQQRGNAYRQHQVGDEHDGQDAAAVGLETRVMGHAQEDSETVPAITTAWSRF
ncbi:hypothetical protein GALL_539510 [mine drainage metagenome]|uniref:Uncharacterized protein n=1 Tax=mine drainage metagenome TaxID=410659 RepID=A0A1J5P0D2_9ZZZZ